MKFKVLKGSSTFDKLASFHQRFAEMIKIRKEVLNKLGSTAFTEPGYCFGGLSGIEFDQKPDGWGFAYRDKSMNLFFPKRNLKKNAEVIALIESVPTISYDELWDCVCDKEYTSFFKHPGFMFQIDRGYVLLSTNDNWPEKLNSDCIEITALEHDQLAAAGKEVSND